jgi:hypothetical protein
MIISQKINSPHLFCDIAQLGCAGCIHRFCSNILLPFFDISCFDYSFLLIFETKNEEICTASNLQPTEYLSDSDDVFPRRSRFVNGLPKMRQHCSAELDAPFSGDRGAQSATIEGINTMESAIQLPRTF